ncbi:MAG: NADH-quinone oxidoreductase subunit C [Rhodomicrobium sp.]
MNGFDVGAVARGVALCSAIDGAIEEQLGVPDGFIRIDVSDALWTGLAKGCAAGWHDLGALWFDDGRMHMALWETDGSQKAIVSVEARHGVYPAVSAHHAPAMRLERAMRDLYDINPMGLPDGRAWLDHGVWPGKPLKTDMGYKFLTVDGSGLHQIPVGPVHAGIIEPGHFRFTANGETVARLEERLGYVHKGVEALCAGASLDKAGKIAARISGDSTVAYSFAFSLAVEAALGFDAPPRAILLRGVMAELERLSHHVNDVGAVCNDASVVAILAHCALIREDILTTAAACFGHRMMMDRIIPGGTACDLDDEKAGAIRALLDRLEASFARVVHAYDQSPSLQDRVQKTGVARPEYVRQFAAGGFVGRASGRAFDARQAFAYPPYGRVEFEVPSRTAGDVDARVWIRIEEVSQSVKMIRQFLDMLEPGPIAAPLPSLRQGHGAAVTEAFRGDVFLSVRLDGDGNGRAGGTVAHLHARDASWFQWPLLETAIKDNIVADFPLCNKSFNCSYSGHDI